MELIKAQQIIAHYCIDHNIIYFSTPSHGNKLRREHPELTGGVIGRVTREFVLLGIFERISKRRYKFEKSKCEKVLTWT
jgi:hypothetical protein